METALTNEFQFRTFSVKLWPPSDRTRQALIDRMATNLSTESILSRKYGLLSKDEANKNAKDIEETCFAIANENFLKIPDGNGFSAVQLYAKETSKLVLEVLKHNSFPKTETETKTEMEMEVRVFDISKGRRMFIEADEAKELLEPLGFRESGYTKICFSNRSFGLEAARVAGPILESIRDQLSEVDLSDFVAGRPEDEALEVMRVFSQALEGCVLKYLNLSDNALGEKGVRAFGSLLKSQKALEELYLMNDGISEEAARALSELIPCTDRLKTLHFHNNMTGDEGAVAISEIVSRSPLLESFRCSSTRIGTHGGISLAEALAGCICITKLDLRDNLFGVEAGLALSKTLMKLTNLKEIYLSYLNLEDKGTIEIINALKGTVLGLEVLELAGNEITIKAAPSLAGFLIEARAIKKLGLAENELKDEGSIIIGKALEECGADLKELDLSVNYIRRAGARSLAQAVAGKEGFVLLDINGNAISDEGIDEIKEILKGLDVLGPLDENDVDLEEEEEEEEREDDEGDEERELEAKLENLNVEEE